MVWLRRLALISPGHDVTFFTDLTRQLMHLTLGLNLDRIGVIKFQLDSAKLS